MFCHLCGNVLVSFHRSKMAFDLDIPREGQEIVKGKSLYGELGRICLRYGDDVLTSKPQHS